MWWSLAFGLFVALPFVACAIRPGVFRVVLALGAAFAGTEWLLAYHSNQVEHGGDWQPGGELLVFTGFFALAYFAVWLVSALLGIIVGRKRGAVRA